MEITGENEMDVLNIMVEEFLEYRLGHEATNENVRKLSEHIIAFENEMTPTRHQNDNSSP